VLEKFMTDPPPELHLASIKTSIPFIVAPDGIENPNPVAFK
jgi:hypothetical protein